MWAAIEDIQQETKAYEDSKGHQQNMLDDQAQKNTVIRSPVCQGSREICSTQKRASCNRRKSCGPRKFQRK